MHSEQINEIALALSKAQGEMTSAHFDKVNPHFKSKYASLDAIWETCREPLSKNGLAVIQIPTTQDGFLCLETILTHASGQWFKSRMPIPTSEKTTPQALGSSITYMKRYALSALVGISAREDDDAEDGQQREVSFKQMAPIKQYGPPVQKKEVKKCEGYDKKCQDLGIIEGGEVMEYIDFCLTKMDISKIEFINRIFENEEQFYDKFQNWKAKKLEAKELEIA